MTLDEIIAHEPFPFADLRDDDASFLMIELHWTSLAREAVGKPFAGERMPLQAARRDDGPEPFRDPVVLDFWHPELRRGARIALLEADEDLPYRRDVPDRTDCKVPAVVYCQRRGVTGPDDEIDRIVFRADMSSLARIIVTGGLRRSLLEGVSPEEMEDQWDDFLDRTGDGPTRAQMADAYAKLDGDGAD